MTRLLVAYGSRRGATAEIAERIGDTLRADGHAVEMLNRIRGFPLPNPV